MYVEKFGTETSSCMENRGKLLLNFCKKKPDLTKWLTRKNRICSKFVGDGL